jgi:hypothetical protein
MLGTGCDGGPAVRGPAGSNGKPSATWSVMATLNAAHRRLRRMTLDDAETAAAASLTRPAWRSERSRSWQQAARRARHPRRQGVGCSSRRPLPDTRLRTGRLAITRRWVHRPGDPTGTCPSGGWPSATVPVDPRRRSRWRQERRVHRSGSTPRGGACGRLRLTSRGRRPERLSLHPLPVGPLGDGLADPVEQRHLRISAWSEVVAVHPHELGVGQLGDQPLTVRCRRTKNPRTPASAWWAPRPCRAGSPNP